MPIHQKQIAHYSKILFIIYSLSKLAVETAGCCKAEESR
jgi:hypothetical protein